MTLQYRVTEQTVQDAILNGGVGGKYVRLPKTAGGGNIPILERLVHRNRISSRVYFIRGLETNRAGEVILLISDAEERKANIIDAP